MKNITLAGMKATVGTDKSKPLNSMSTMNSN